MLVLTHGSMRDKMSDAEARMRIENAPPDVVRVTTVRGYKVTVRWRAIPADEAVARRAAIARMIAQNLMRHAAISPRDTKEIAR